MAWKRKLASRKALLPLGRTVQVSVRRPARPSRPMGVTGRLLGAVQRLLKAL